MNRQNLHQAGLSGGRIKNNQMIEKLMIVLAHVKHQKRSFLRKMKRFFSYLFFYKSGRRNPRRKEQFVFKVLVLSDGSVDKTSIMKKYMDNTFEPDYKSTIGVQFMTKVVQTEKTTTKLVLWDVAGQSKFTSYRHLYYKDAEGILLLFDKSKPKSFKNLPHLLEESLPCTAKNTKIALLGIKNEREELIDNNEIKFFIKKNPNIISYREYDIQSNGNVNKLLKKLVHIIIQSCSRAN